MKVDLTNSSDCSSCNASGGATCAGDASQGSFTLAIPTAKSNGGMSGGTLYFFTPNMTFPGRAGLTAIMPSDFGITRDGNGLITQINTGAGVIDVADGPNPNSITIQHKDLNGLSFRDTVISLVSDGGMPVLRMDSTFDGDTTRYQQKETAPGTTVLEKGRVTGTAFNPGTTFNPLYSETLVKNTSTPGVEIKTTTIKERASAAGTLQMTREVEETWEKQVYGWVKTKEIIHPSGAALTSTWSYYQPGESTGPGASVEGIGRLKQHSRYDGYQSFYTYALNPESVTTPYAGNAAGQTTTTTHNPGTNTDTTITTVGGVVISKTVTAKVVNANEHYQTRDTYTSAGAKLTTVTNYKIQGTDFIHKPIKIEHPDNTLTTYSYSRDASTGGYTTIMDNGEANIGKTAVVKGMRTITVKNSRGTTILSQTQGIGYDTGTADLGNMAVTSVDNLGRALVTAYHADTVVVAGDQASATNPKWTTSTSYNCCGVESETDMYGITTYYAYDELRRPIKTNRMGVTTETVSKGLTTETYRYAQTVSGTLSSTFAGTDADLINKSVRNLTGTVNQSYGPDPSNPTNDPDDFVVTSTTTNYQPGAGLSSSTVTTTPDNFSQTTTSYLDGKTFETTGALSPAMRYAYAVNATGETSTQSYLDGVNLRETTTSQSDWAGRTIRVDYMDGAFATMTYNALGQMVKSTDPDGVTTVIEFDLTGDRVVTAIDLDNDGNVDYGSDIVSFSDTYPKSAHGTNVMRSESKVWQPGGGEIVLSYSDNTPDGLRSWSTQFPGSDNRESNTLTTLLGGGDWTIEASSTDDTTQFQTYTDGLLVSSEWKKTNSALIVSAGYGYDSLNRQTSVTDSRTALEGNKVTAYLSATLDMVASVADPGNRTTSFTYDVRGRRTVVNAPEGNTTTTVYNPDSTVAETTGDKVYRTTHNYDYANRQVSMTTYGTSQATTTWTYSTVRGFMTAKIFPGPNSTSYTYTPAGRFKTRTWARGKRTRYDYDSAGRLTNTRYFLTAAGDTGSNAGNDTSTPDVAIAYDCISRTVTKSNGLATSSYSYDGDTLELATETITYDFIPGGTPEFTRVINRSSDNLGRSTGYALMDGATPDAQAAYAYGAADGRLATVTGPTGPFTYGYTAGSANLLASVTGPVHSVTNTWEPTRDVLEIKENKVGTTLVSGYDYSVNNYGQRINVSTSGSAFPATPSYVWGYNAAGEIISADSSDNSYDRAYEYDGIGNRLEAVEGTTTLTGTANYTPNALNQYSAVGAINPSYDLDGNATAYPLPAHASANSSLIWDGDNRLTQVDVNGTATTYQYDSQSRRISKATGSNVTVYVYDGWNPIAEYNTSYTLTKTYTWGMDLSGSMQGAGGVGGLLLITDHSALGTPSYYPAYDGNGNVSEYLDDTGATTAHFEYDPFGRTLVDTDTLGQFRFRFSTKMLDLETGLYYYGYRYYDPETGRWPSRDPIGEQGGTNLYGFVGNDGVNQLDVLGMLETFGLTYTEAKPTCGDRSLVFLDYKLDNKSPNGGFFVQQNDIVDTSTNCIGSDKKNSSDKFWEAFMVPKNSDRFVGASFVPTNDPKKPIYSDVSSSPIPDWTCGSSVKTKVMKFFPGTTTGNLGWPPIPGVTTGGNPEDPDWKITPGKLPAGNLPWTRKEPGWWGNASHTITVKITVTWTCCTVKQVNQKVEIIK